LEQRFATRDEHLSPLVKLKVLKTIYIPVVAITPDTKDWTWVLERPCRECGFDAASFGRDEIGSRLRDNAAIWRIELVSGDGRVRSNESRWSVLEYACHVRDVFRIFDERLSLMQSRDDPLFANWDQDATADADRYDLQDPAVVGPELSSAAETLATRMDGIREDEWTRPGRRSNGSVFTIESLSRYLLHDCVHHLWDVQTG